MKYKPLENQCNLKHAHINGYQKYILLFTKYAFI